MWWVPSLVWLGGGPVTSPPPEAAPCGPLFCGLRPLVAFADRGERFSLCGGELFWGWGCVCHGFRLDDLIAFRFRIQIDGATRAGCSLLRRHIACGMGRDLIQCTGRFNYRNLTAWVRRLFPAAPDFEQTPEALERPEWLGISVVWFFTTRPKLMAACEAGDCVRVSEIVNGGHNGLADRLALYVRCALVLLGYSATDVRGFQEAAGIAVDGMAGQVTRTELHRALKAKASGVKVIAEIPPRTPEAFAIETPDPEPQPSLWRIILTILGITKG